MRQSRSRAAGVLEDQREQWLLGRSHRQVWRGCRAMKADSWAEQIQLRWFIDHRELAGDEFRCVKPQWESDYHASGMFGPRLIGESFPLGSHFLPDLFRPGPFTLCSVFKQCSLSSSVALLLVMTGNDFSNSKGKIWHEGADPLHVFQ